jgi:hypothetical protein
VARKPIIPIRADEPTKARWLEAAGDTPLAEFIRQAVEEKIERVVHDFTVTFTPTTPLLDLAQREGGKRSYAPDPKGGKPK